MSTIDWANPTPFTIGHDKIELLKIEDNLLSMLVTSQLEYGGLMFPKYGNVHLDRTEISELIIALSDYLEYCKESS